MERKLHSIKESRENILSDVILTHDRQNANQQSVQDAIRGDMSPKAIHLDERADAKTSMLNQEYLIHHGREILQEKNDVLSKK